MNIRRFRLRGNFGLKLAFVATHCLFAAAHSNIAVQADEPKQVEKKVAVETLTVSTEKLLEELRRHPDRSKLKSLTITPDDGERPSLECLRELPNLESLDLTGNRFDEKALRPLEALSKLKELSLNGNDIGTRCVSDTVCKLPTLEVLDLRRTVITNAAFPYIAKIKTLRKLSLGFTRIKRPSTYTSEEPFTVLAKLSGLAELELRGLFLRHDDLLSLGELKSLRKIDLGSHIILGSPDTFVELKRLLPSVPLAQTYLWQHHIHSEMDGQDRLVLVGRHCTTKNLKAIIEMGETCALQTLAIEASTALPLVAKIPTLRHLTIESCELGDKDLVFIVSLPELESLILDNCTVTCSLASWRKLLALKTLKRIENALSDIPEELQELAGDKLRPAR